MKDPKTERAEQLAKALRENLRRRKAQTRTRIREDDADSPERPDQQVNSDSAPD